MPSRISIPSASLLVAASISIAGGPAPTNGPTPDQALQMLREGNARFVSGAAQNPHADAARRAEVAAGQNPFAVVLSCADSRVPVEVLFDQGIGDVFVIRVAGNVSDTDEIGTIEYGVGHLHSPLVVVMGHSACGAVKAVAAGAEVHGSIPGLVDNIIPAVEWVKKNRPDLSGDALINAAIEANVWQSIDDLISHSEEVQSHLAQGKIQVVGAVYDLASGKVRWLGEHPYQSTLIEGAAQGHASPDDQHGAADAHQPATNTTQTADAHQETADPHETVDHHEPADHGDPHEPAGEAPHPHR